MDHPAQGPARRVAQRAPQRDQAEGPGRLDHLGGSGRPLRGGRELQQALEHGQLQQLVLQRRGDHVGGHEDEDAGREVPRHRDEQQTRPPDDPLPVLLERALPGHVLRLLVLHQRLGRRHLRVHGTEYLDVREHDGAREHRHEPIGIGHRQAVQPEGGLHRKTAEEVRVVRKAAHGHEGRHVQRHLEEEEVPGALEHEELPVFLLEGLHLLGDLGDLLLVPLHAELPLLLCKLHELRLDERLLPGATRRRHADGERDQADAEASEDDGQGPRASGRLVNVDQQRLHEVHWGPWLVGYGHVHTPRDRCLHAPLQQLL
mmetsp:Transcript_35467/g.110605  ORF Transcript_35467/g.110605 Transcript_35467/m.110605 type:complete len:316 (-) Transcript_35467:70-1017(-)